LLVLIARLVEEEEEVASVYFNGVEPTDGQTVVPDEAGWRPALSVSVDDEQGQAAVVSALESSTEPQAFDATVPRASFKSGSTRYKRPPSTSTASWGCRSSRPLRMPSNNPKPPHL
jgi:hypothetical protein